MPGIIEPVGAPDREAPKTGWLGRIAWFVGLSAGGVLATAVVAYALHAALRLG